ncbi:MAG: phosphatase PAP2 family protein [Lachnospiraceae bacterium]|nr:phosphatase PAP2 family protein [Lachnospiraceae bacterium]
MTEDRYKSLMETLSSKGIYIMLINGADMLITLAVFLVYVIGVIRAFISGAQYLIPMTVIPSISFVLVSVFRRLYNAKRPYEVYGIPAVLKKDSSGKSFPSRHIFSVFVIGVTFFPISPAVSIAVLALGIIQGTLRVIGGVHFIKDVICGALLGIVCGSLAVGIILATLSS